MACCVMIPVEVAGGTSKRGNRAARRTLQEGVHDAIRSDRNTLVTIKQDAKSKSYSFLSTQQPVGALIWGTSFSAQRHDERRGVLAIAQLGHREQTQDRSKETHIRDRSASSNRGVHNRHMGDRIKVCVGDFGGTGYPILGTAQAKGERGVLT